MSQQEKQIFDSLKYPTEIQFRYQPLDQRKTHCLTIDLQNSSLSVHSTTRLENKTECRHCKIPRDQCLELLQFLTLENIQLYELLVEEKPRDLWRGWWDCWYPTYSYFTNNPAYPRTDGSFGQIYEGSPFEEAIKWAKRCFPEMFEEDQFI